ncbi:snoRNA-binding rRNA-processing protein [Gonapodya sp. JEL0774]|nr:snoRNA-binding rRNA-processing protein [Gonapodya sp. JEL0774]
MGDYRKLTIRTQPHLLGVPSLSGSKWWKAFKAPLLVKEHNPISSIHFSQSAPHDFAVTLGTRVQIYSATSCALKKTLSRFESEAFSATIRNDGKLLVAGDASGTVQLFDLSSRAILRTYKDHSGPVRVTKFLPSNTQIVSGGHDKTVRVFDIAQETAVRVIDRHGDYVRTISVCDDNPNLFLSGSYDHTLLLHDLRQPTPALHLSHSAPVESSLLLRSSTTAVSAGASEVKVWDIVAGGKPVRAMGNHQKTVVALAVAGGRGVGGGTGAGILAQEKEREQYVVSGGLDGMVKVYETRDWEVVHTIKYSDPVLAVAVSPDSTRLAVGTKDGLLSVRRRERHVEPVAAAASTFASKKLQRAQSGDDLFQVEKRRRQRLAPYDKLLKTFNYAKALDQVLTTNQQVATIVSVCEELMHRDGLRTALAGRDEVGLEPLVRFLLKNVTNPRVAGTVIDVAEMVLDLYAPVAAHSILITDLFEKIRVKVRAELDLQERLIALEGTVDMLLMQVE